MILSLDMMVTNAMKFISCAMAVQRARAFSEYEYKFRLREDLSQMVLRPNPIRLKKNAFLSSLKFSKKTFSKPNYRITSLNKCIFVASMIIITLIFCFMDAKTIYRITFVGNEPYKNHRKRLNNRMKRQSVRVTEDDYWNLSMFKDLAKSMWYYVRKSILEVFRISEFQNPRNQNFSQSKFRTRLTNMTF